MSIRGKQQCGIDGEIPALDHARDLRISHLPDVQHIRGPSCHRRFEQCAAYARHLQITAHLQGHAVANLP
jgi:hypothetical protein